MSLAQAKSQFKNTIYFLKFITICQKRMIAQSQPMPPKFKECVSKILVDQNNPIIAQYPYKNIFTIVIGRKDPKHQKSKINSCLGRVAYPNSKNMLIQIETLQLFQKQFEANPNVLWKKTYEGKFQIYIDGLPLKQDQYTSTNVHKALEMFSKQVQKFLNVIGAAKSFNKTSLQMVKLKLETKKKAAQLSMPNKKENKENQTGPLNPTLNFSSKQNQKILNVKNIQFTSQQNSYKTTGYFVHQKGECMMQDQNQNKITKQVVFKQHSKVNQHLQKNNRLRCQMYIQKSKQQLQKQCQIVSNIKDPKFIPNYYTCKNGQDFGYIVTDYIKKNLNDVVQTEELSLRQKLSLSKQLIQAVYRLHQSGVVHRSLQPQSIFVEIDSNNQKNIKIGNFQASNFMNGKNEVDLASQYPYAPPQCYKKRKFDKEDNKSSIDLWSLNTLLGKIISGHDVIKLMCGGATFHEQKAELDESAFVNLSMREKNGVGLIKYIFNLLIIHSTMRSPEDRISLNNLYKYIQILENNYQKTSYWIKICKTC